MKKESKKHALVANKHPKPWVVKWNLCDQWVEDAKGDFVVHSSGYAPLARQPGAKIQRKTFREICRLFNQG